jgi:hypothetical protein
MHAQWYLLVIGLLAGAGLAVWESRVKEPFLDLRLLAGNLPLLATYGRNLLGMTVGYAFLYGFTQWLEDSRGLDATQAGLLLIPLPLVGLAVSATTGRRPQIREKLIVGSLTQLAGSILLLTLSGHSAIWHMALVAMVFGIPQGLNNLANQSAVYYQADPDRLASSSGLLRTFMYLGAMIAASANGAFFGQTASTTGLHHMAIFLIVVAALFAALTLIDRSLHSRPWLESSHEGE